MNNVNDVPVDVEEMREWANAYRESFDPDLPWKKFAGRTEIAESTLQAFCKGTYLGVNENVARKIYQYMQSTDSRNQASDQLPTNPGYFETKTSRRIRSLLQYAHMGRITVIATGPGTGKTLTMRDYQERAKPVWPVTMMSSTARLNPMIQQVQKALTLEVRHGNIAGASRAVIGRVRDRKGLLIIDEAQHLLFEAFEEIRAWHDETGVGVAFLGNDTLLERIESGRMSDAFGRLNSRIASKHVQKIPEEEDVDAYCDAWLLTNPAVRRFLRTIARTPNSGGLRECTMLIESASMIAASYGRGLTIDDLRLAQSTRATRWVKA